MILDMILQHFCIWGKGNDKMHIALLFLLSTPGFTMGWNDFWRSILKKISKYPSRFRYLNISVSFWKNVQMFHQYFVKCLYIHKFWLSSNPLSKMFRYVDCSDILVWISSETFWYILIGSDIFRYVHIHFVMFEYVWTC